MNNELAEVNVMLFEKITNTIRYEKIKNDDEMPNILQMLIDEAWVYIMSSRPCALKVERYFDTNKINGDTNVLIVISENEASLPEEEPMEVEVLVNGKKLTIKPSPLEATSWVKRIR